MRFLSLIFLLFISSFTCGQTTCDEVRQALLSHGNPEFENCKISLLPSAREKYADMFSAIRDAEYYVHLEYFIFRLDSIGSELINLLHEKVQQGVEVRLLIDAYGNWKAPCPMTDERMDSIRALGIKLAVFDPIRFPWLPNLLHRDHRKIVVVDGKYAWTGGMNVADYYIHGTERTGPWRDMQARFEGPIVDEFQKIFVRIWEKTSGEDLFDLRYRVPSETKDGLNMIMVNREPKTSNRQIRRAYVSLLDAAKEEVRIVNPYPTNTHSVRLAMKRALRRGVNVKVMVSSSSDNRVVPDVIAVQMKNFADHGAEIFYYDAGFHHTKVITVDGAISMVGTANMDGRSMRYDYEVNVVVFDSLTTSRLNKIFDDDTKDCHMMERKYFRKEIPLRHRFIGRVFQPIKGLL